MRKNLPISDVEFVMQDGRPIVSKTDLKGRITYANPYFIEVSGYSEEELLGQPHNVVRHPDMPESAFEDLWKTLKKGELWSALVKNRRKNGDFYWVLANATPISENGRVVGYMSVRTKPTREQIAAAEAAYAELAKGQSSRLAVVEGHVVKKGIHATLRKLLLPSLKRRSALSCAGQAGLVITAIATLFFSPSNGVPALAMLALLGSILLSLQLWMFIHRSIATPLAEATSHAQALAAGDLLHEVPVTMSGDIGRLQQALHQMNVNLLATIGDIRANVSLISTATGEIAAGNMDLSSRTETQASSLEQTASSMEEFAATISHNASNAQDANTLAAHTSSIAKQAGQVVCDVGRTMDEISDSARRVAEIIGVIDGIAFQTNILALNAAVEAARAGEAGRGFAVVAAEVRGLAQRSAIAAGEIKSLIQNSVQRVSSGNELVTTARNTMNEVVDAVGKLTAIVGDIASASKEQAIGVRQVNQAVSHMDQVTQENASLVEEAAAASASLHEQAVRLTGAVAVFNTGSQTYSAAALRLTTTS